MLYSTAIIKRCSIICLNINDIITGEHNSSYTVSSSKDGLEFKKTRLNHPVKNAKAFYQKVCTHSTSIWLQNTHEKKEIKLSNISSCFKKTKSIKFIHFGFFLKFMSLFFLFFSFLRLISMHVTCWYQIKEIQDQEQTNICTKLLNSLESIIRS